MVDPRSAPTYRPRYTADWRFLLRLGVVFLLGLLGADATAGWECSSAPEKLRFDLHLLLAQVETVTADAQRLSGGRDHALRQMVEALDRGAAELTDRELDRLCGVFERFPGLWEAPSLLSAALPPAPEPRAPAESCLSLPRETYLTLFIALQVLELTGVTAQAVCDASACPVYAGVTVCLPAPPECSIVCPITVGVVEVLVLAAEAVLFLDDNCSSVDHYGAVQDFAAETGMTLDEISSVLASAVVPRLDASLSSRASQTSLDELGTSLASSSADLGGALDVILSDLADQGAARQDFQDRDLRLRIEASLQERASGPISSHRLPGSLGGQIELVREIVAATIQMNLQAGEDVAHAQGLFDRADLLLNQQLYREAFDRYRLAYQAAAGESRSSPTP